MGRRVALLAVVAGMLAGAGSARAATPQELTITAADGTPLACALVEPDGTPPAGGWPGVMLFHGLGGKHQDMEPFATGFLAPAGYASLMCDARGEGASGGLFGLDGPTDVADTQFLFSWFAARPEISDTEIGAYGISLGGGAVWNAAAAGVPFKAIVPVTTWTNLTTALAPQGLSKSGLVTQLAARGADVALGPGAARRGAVARDEHEHRAGEHARAPRSVAHAPASLTVPTLLIQGRHDFLFDIDQAEAAYRLLKGPRRLYLGDLGHPPAPNPVAEHPTYFGLAVQWFDRFLKGTPNGVDRQATVELAHDPWDGKTTTYTGLPPTKTASVVLPGTTTISDGRQGRARRAADRRPARDVRRLDGHRPLLRSEGLGPARRRAHGRRPVDADQRRRHQAGSRERRRHDPPDERERARARGREARRLSRRDLDGAEQQRRALPRRRAARLVDHDRP